jgi:hypothetical protein
MKITKIELKIIPCTFKIMELPEDVLQLIREYSKPLTHPNWRNRQWICVGDLYTDIFKQYIECNKKRNLYIRFIHNVQKNNCWVDLYLFVTEHGILEMSNFYDIKLKVCYDIIHKN